MTLLQCASVLGRPRQRGVGLIEIMVGLTAGLILVGVLAYFLIGGRQINRTHDDVSRMQESGRTALEIMGKAIRQARARKNLDDPLSATALVPTEGASGAPDSLTVRYEVQDGGEADCLGNTVATGTVTYVFAVDTTTNSLTCSNGGAGVTPVVVMDNIENMQIAYGVDTNGDGRIESYNAATDIAPAGSIPTTQVVAVRVSLMVRGPTQNVATGSQTLTYNGASVTKSDRYLRQVFASTFALRNKS